MELIYRFFAFFAVALFMFIVWIIFNANMGHPSIFHQVVASYPNGDKYGHFVMFGLFTLACNIGLKLKTLNCGPINIYIGTLVVTLFAFAEEMSQGLVATRKLSFHDLLADAAGILLFTLASYFLARRFNTQQA